MNLLCAVGLHRRIRDRDIPTQRNIFTYVDEYVCRRCPARWGRHVIVLGDDLDIWWERIA